MEEINFSSLKDCLEIDDAGVSYEESIPDFKNKTQKLREHFFKFLPDGYSKEEIEKMSYKELHELDKYLTENHCFKA